MGRFNLDDYEPVEVRIAKFWELYPEGRIITELVFHSPEQFIVRAEAYRTQEGLLPFATGYAEERVSDNFKMVNFASAMENCETSAIGRCLANGGFAPKGKRPSQSEMAKVNRMTATTPLTSLELLKSELMGYSDEADVRRQYVTDVVGREIKTFGELTEDEVNVLRDSLSNKEKVSE